MHVAPLLIAKNNDYQSLLVGNILASLACFLAVEIGLEFSYLSSYVSLFNLATGVAVGIAIAYGVQYSLGIVLGSALALYFNYEPLSISLVIAIGLVIEAVLVRNILQRYFTFNTNLEYIPDVLKLLVAGMSVVIIFGATYLTLALFLLDAASIEFLQLTWLTICLGKIAGICVITPFILVWSQKLHFNQNWLKLIELAGMITLLILCGGTIFGWFGDITHDQLRYPLAYLFFPILAWSAFRFGQRVATFATMTLAFFALWGLTNNLSPFLRDSTFESHFFTWLYINVASVLAMILAADITECKKIRVALKQSDERLTLATSGSQDGLWDWVNLNEDGMWWSNNFYQLLGYQEEEINPTIKQLENLMHADDRIVHQEALQTHLEKIAPYNIEFRLLTKDQGYRWFHAKAEAVYNEKSKTQRMAGSIIDVHDKKRAQQEIINLNQELEQRVVKRTNELVDINNDLRQEIMERNKAELEIVKLQNDLIRMGRVSTMGEMATTLAHELHQPLMAIVNYSQSVLLDLNQKPSKNKNAINDVANISEQALRGGEIVRKMKEFALKGQITTERFDINELLIELKPLIDIEVAQNNIKLEMVLCNDELIAEIKHIQMQHVISSLIKNSIESMKYNTNKKLLTIHTYKDNDMSLKIKIADNGGGISNEHLNKIFDSFYTTKSNGLGLGLSVSEKIIKQHRGSIKIENQEVGVIACITLPLIKI